MRGIGGGDRRTTFRHYKGAKESGPGFKTRDLYLPWHFALPSPNLTTSQVHESPRLSIPFLWSLALLLWACVPLSAGVLGVK